MHRFNLNQLQPVGTRSYQTGHKWKWLQETQNEEKRNKENFKKLTRASSVSNNKGECNEYAPQNWCISIRSGMRFVDKEN